MEEALDRMNRVVTAVLEDGQRAPPSTVEKVMLNNDISASEAEAAVSPAFQQVTGIIPLFDVMAHAILHTLTGFTTTTAA